MKVNDNSCKQEVHDSENGKACMYVKRVAETLTVCEKQCHACDNSEMQTKTEMVLVQPSMHANDNKYLLKSSRQCSHKAKHKTR